MRDDLQGGLLATLIAAPILVICCGGGVLLAAAAAALGSWLTGLGDLGTILVAAIAALTMRSNRRAHTACALPDADNKTGKSAIHDT